MRRLVSKEDQARQRKKNQFIVGIILMVLMIFSVLGYAIQSALGSGNSSDNSVNGQTVKYNGFEFTQYNGIWVLDNFAFRYNPNEVGSDILGSLNNIDTYQGQPLYIASNNSNAEAEVQLNLGQVALRTQKACLESSEGGNCPENLPVKSCTDKFIIIKEDTIPGVRQEGGCVYIQGPKEKLVDLADQFLFNIMGIK